MLSDRFFKSVTQHLELIVKRLFAKIIWNELKVFGLVSPPIRDARTDVQDEEIFFIIDGLDCDFPETKISPVVNSPISII